MHDAVLLLLGQENTVYVHMIFITIFLTYDECETVRGADLPSSHLTQKRVHRYEDATVKNNASERVLPCLSRNLMEKLVSAVLLKAYLTQLASGAPKTHK